MFENNVQSLEAIDPIKGLMSQKKRGLFKREQMYHNNFFWGKKLVINMRKLGKHLK